MNGSWRTVREPRDSDLGWNAASKREMRVYFQANVFVGHFSSAEALEGWLEVSMGVAWFLVEVVKTSHHNTPSGECHGLQR